MPYVNGYPEHNFAVFARDARDTLTPNATQRTTLIVAACYIVAIAKFNNVSTEGKLTKASYIVALLKWVRFTKLLLLSGVDVS